MILISIYNSFSVGDFDDFTEVIKKKKLKGTKVKLTTTNKDSSDDTLIFITQLNWKHPLVDLRQAASII